MKRYLNWKIFLVLVAIAIVGASLIYTNRLAARLSEQERNNVAQLAEGIRTIATSTNNEEIGFAGNIVGQNKTIPVIITDDQGNIIDNKNLDSARAARDSSYVPRKLAEFRALHPAIVSDFGFGKNYIYYGQSYLLTQLRYFPYVQLTIIVLFLVVVVIAITAAQRNMQNQVWVGLSKETAHQLGTPLSSLEAWLELLRDQDANREAVTEMQKDFDRLKLVADRFSKVGSAPKLQEENLVDRMREIVAYMQHRAPSRVKISLETNDEQVPMMISGPLFDWVIENLIRNALDAMDGTGSIRVNVQNHPYHIYIDVTDTGKGIPKHQLKKVFLPGFTTKQRGWGLGLSLSKRIVEQYHHGTLVVRHSELGKGTTFRVTLRR